MGSALKSIRFVHCNTEENCFDDLGGMAWDDPIQVAVHWESIPVVSQESSNYIADLLDDQEDIIDEKRVSLDFVNYVLRKAKERE